jgi:hypothetical protein
MRIHTDILTTKELHETLPAGVSLFNCSIYGSRSRARAYEVTLRGHETRHTKHPADVNSNLGYAATHDDWGWWLAALYVIDPNMIAGPYKSRDDFNRQTASAYVTEDVVS